MGLATSDHTSTMVASFLGQAVAFTAAAFPVYGLDKWL